MRTLEFIFLFNFHSCKLLRDKFKKFFLGKKYISLGARDGRQGQVCEITWATPFRNFPV